MFRHITNVYLAALKFFRNLVGLQDEFYNQQMMQDHLFEPILNVVYETMPRDNLLNSACLELFEFIKRENIKKLVEHLVENYRDKIKDITYIDTFKVLVKRYDDSYNASMETSFVETEAGTPTRHQSGGRRWNELKGLDAAEEEYFNTSDNEEESPAKSSPDRPSIINGASPVSKPLVDYNSDEEGDNMETDASAGTLVDESSEAISATTSEGTVSPAATVPTPPPERLSEKRRREEDEEDELGKLSQNKRRSSNSSISSISSNSLRKKKPFNNTKDAGGGAPRKIAISIGTSPKAETTTSDMKKN